MTKDSNKFLEELYDVEQEHTTFATTKKKTKKDAPKYKTTDSSTI